MCTSLRRNTIPECSSSADHRAQGQWPSTTLHGTKLLPLPQENSVVLLFTPQHLTKSPKSRLIFLFTPLHLTKSPKNPQRAPNSLVVVHKKTASRLHCLLFDWRCHPDSDRGMKVLQTFALPLGYGTVKNGAVDETRTRDLHLGKVALYQLSYYRWCLGAESNHPHCDFQSHALPTELPRQVWRPGRGSNPRPPA